MRVDVIFCRWETAAEDTGLTPTAGGATLQYEGNASAWGTKVSGGFNSVVPTTLGTYLPWLATGGALKETTEDVGLKKQADEAFLKYCLLAKPDAMAWSVSVYGSLAISLSLRGSYSSLLSLTMKKLNKVHSHRSPDIMGAALTTGTFHAAPTATSKMAKLDKSTWKSAQGTTEFCVDQARLALLVQTYLLY